MLPELVDKAQGLHHGAPACGLTNSAPQSLQYGQKPGMAWKGLRELVRSARGAPNPIWCCGSCRYLPALQPEIRTTKLCGPQDQRTGRAVRSVKSLRDSSWPIWARTVHSANGN